MFAIMMIMMMVMSATLPSWMRIRTRMMRRTRPSTVSRKRKAPCGGALKVFKALSAISNFETT